MIQSKSTEAEIKSKILEKQGEFCKLFTNHHRLQILHVLMEDIPNSEPSETDVFEIKKTRKELTVSQIHEAIKDEFEDNLSQTTLSQHLSILRKNRAVTTRREGNNNYYKIANPKLMVTCGIVRQIVMDFLRKDQFLLTDSF